MLPNRAVFLLESLLDSFLSDIPQKLNSTFWSSYDFAFIGIVSISDIDLSILSFFCFIPVLTSYYVTCLCSSLLLCFICDVCCSSSLSSFFNCSWTSLIVSTIPFDRAFESLFFLYLWFLLSFFHTVCNGILSIGLFSFILRYSFASFLIWLITALILISVSFLLLSASSESSSVSELLSDLLFPFCFTGVFWSSSSSLLNFSSNNYRRILRARQYVLTSFTRSLVLAMCSLTLTYSRPSTIYNSLDAT